MELVIMEVKIFTEAGGKIGYGHLTRCTALCEELERRRIPYELVIFAEDDMPFETVNWMNRHYLENFLGTDFYCIVDSYLAKEEHYRVIAQRAKRALYIDDTGRLTYPEGYILNPALGCYNVDYSGILKENILSGKDYILFRRPFQIHCQEIYPKNQRREMEEEIKRVLIIMGGTDVQGLTEPICQALYQAYPMLELDVVVCDGIYEYFVQKMNELTIHVHRNLSAEEMRQFMFESDLVITAAGQTIYELIATQTPFIAWQVAENQKNNIEGIRRLLPSVPTMESEVGEAVTSAIQRLLKCFSTMIPKERRKKCWCEMQGLIDGQGVARSIDRLLYGRVEKDGFFVRHVEPQDMEAVFALSNEEAVRRYALHPEKIKWADHVRWFRGKLCQESGEFYVVTNNQRQFLGQIRFDVDGKQGVISVSLSEKIRGKGMGACLVKKGLALFFDEVKSVEEVRATVYEKNTASMHLFEKLNFELMDSQYINKKKFMIYKLERRMWLEN